MSGAAPMSAFMPKERQAHARALGGFAFGDGRRRVGVGFGNVWKQWLVHDAQSNAPHPGALDQKERVGARGFVRRLNIASPPTFLMQKSALRIR